MEYVGFKYLNGYGLAFQLLNSYAMFGYVLLQF